MHLPIPHYYNPVERRHSCRLTPFMMRPSRFGNRRFAKGTPKAQSQGLLPAILLWLLAAGFSASMAAAETTPATNAPSGLAFTNTTSTSPKGPATKVDTNGPMNHFFFYKWPQKPKVIPPAPPLRLTPGPKRISEEAMANDRKFFDDLSQRLDKLKLDPAAPEYYHWTKAQSWLALAREEWSNEDVSGMVEAAVAQTTNLLSSLERPGNAIPMATPIPAPAKRVRDDLWQLADQLKQATNFMAGQDLVAKFEVQLVWAGHKDRQLGWRAARPGLEQAEKLAGEAQMKIAGDAAIQARKPVGVVPSPGTGNGARYARTNLNQRAYLESLQARIAALNRAGVPLSNYDLAKAQHWLDFASSEYHAKDYTGVVKAAADEALFLVRKLEAGEADIPRTTKLLPTAKKVRPDLWQLAEELKQSPKFERGAAIVAQLEVQLVWAGHESERFGWRASRPYIQIAEDLAAKAKKRIHEAEVSEPATENKGSQ